MSDDPSRVTTIRAIIDNADWLTNWLTSIAFAGLFSLATSTVKDKLTFASIIISFCVACLIAMTVWPIMLVYGYGGLIPTMLLAVVCGTGGFAILLTFIGVIRRYIKHDGRRTLETFLRTKTEDKDA